MADLTIDVRRPFEVRVRGSAFYEVVDSNGTAWAECWAWDHADTIARALNATLAPPRVGIPTEGK